MMDLEKREKFGEGVNRTTATNDGGGGYDEAGSGSSCMRTAEMVLRLIPVGLCVAALVVMLKNSQSIDYGSISYSDIGAFKYLVHANGICAGYSLLSAVVSAVPRPATISRAWTIFCLDQLLTYLLLAAASVSTEVLYLAYHGDSATTWSKACDSFGGFCHKARASIAVTFLVVVCYTLLCILSSYRLFSRFDAPPLTTTTNTNTNTNTNTSSSAKAVEVGTL